MQTIILATGNKGKIREILQVFAHVPVRLAPLSQYPDAPKVEEDGKTFMENAKKKARTIAKHLKAWAMGEDSGIEVDALDGAPGIHSARYAGGDEKNNQKLLRELKNVPDEKRTARYRCAIAVSDEKGKIVASAEGTCEGLIGREPRGESGFGYDPIFVLPDFAGRTMAEVGMEVKNRISHRARALARLREALLPVLDPTYTGR